MRKIIISFILVFFLASNSHAWLPVWAATYFFAGLPATVVEYSLVAHATAGAAAAAYWAYNKVTGGSKSVNSSGTIGSTGQVQWVELNNDQFATHGSPATATVSANDVSTKVNSDPAKYPTLRKAVEYATASYVDPALTSDYSTIGTNTVVLNNSDGHYYKATTLYGSFEQLTRETPVNYIQYVNGRMDVAYSVEYFNTDLQQTRYRAYYKTWNVQDTGNTKPAPTAPDTNKYKNAVATMLNGADKFALSDDIDNLIKDNPSVVKYEDENGNNALNKIPPSALTPTQISQKQALDAAAVATSSALAAKDAATTAAFQACSESQMAPENPALKQFCDEATARKNTAEAAYQTSLANEALIKSQQTATNEQTKALTDIKNGTSDTVSAPDLPANNVYPGTSEIEQPNKKDISSLLTSFVDSSPITAMIRSFAISTSGATAVLSAGSVYGKELKFDFTRYEDLFRNLGGVLLVVSHGLSVMIVIRGWKGGDD